MHGYAKMLWGWFLDAQVQEAETYITHLFVNLLPNLTLIPILTLLPNLGGFHRTLQRVRLANRGRLLLRTPGPVPFGTCICSNVETILSWTCHVYGPFEFRTSLGTSILLKQIMYMKTFKLHFLNQSPDYFVTWSISSRRCTMTTSNLSLLFRLVLYVFLYTHRLSILCYEQVGNSNIY